MKSDMSESSDFTIEGTKPEEKPYLQMKRGILHCLHPNHRVGLHR
jgi:hypothetical protein